MSLNARIVLAASLVLAIFLALTGVALDRAFRDSALTAREERLQGQLYLLIAAAEVDAGGRLAMPEQLQEARFGQPGSGLYATIADAGGKENWRSHSALSIVLPEGKALGAGKKHFAELPNANGVPFLVYRMGVNWSEGKHKFAFTFGVAEDLAPFKAQLARYRASLWGWLGAMSLLLLLAQGMLLRWGLGPLRRVAAEIRAIEGGEIERLGSDYPAELKALTENLNGLLQRERAQQQRYRDALGDLAHSLKTPLAVMRGALSETMSLATTVAEESEKMQRIVDYQLLRAATMGPSSPLVASVLIGPLAGRIMASLDKVYRNKAISAEIHTEKTPGFRGDEGDLLELLGNLLDNAYKWSINRVRLSIGEAAGKLMLVVEDDGPGISPDDVARILQRGARADQSLPGQGIGLAVVSSIVKAYGGEIEIGKSTLGGAGITIRLPQGER